MKSYSSFASKVYEIVKCIPKGKVATYGMIATLSGNPNAARAVGQVLHKNPDPIKIPCHRIVSKNGRLAPSFAFGGEVIQKMLLKKENVDVSNENKVDLKKYMWNGI